MKEIPIPYVRANQTAMVIFLAIALAFQLPWLILAVWVIEAAGLAFGLKGNLFVQAAKPLLKRYAAGANTEAAELQRFNNSIAVILLTLSILSYWAGWHIAGAVFAGMVALAAFIAICGFCVGCFLYFQYKQFRARRR